jgi:hypothetical protein
VINHQAGEFNTKVRIEQLDATQDAYGAPVADVDALLDLVVPHRAGHRQRGYGNQAIEAKAQLKLDGNFIAGVTAKMRVNDHGTSTTSRRRRSTGTTAARYMTLLAKTGLNRG